jgi:hypothetical protein
MWVEFRKNRNSTNTWLQFSNFAMSNWYVDAQPLARGEESVLLMKMLGHGLVLDLMLINLLAPILEAVLILTEVLILVYTNQFCPKECSVTYLAEQLEAQP